MNTGVPLSDLKNKLLTEFAAFAKGLNGSATGDIFDARRKAIDAFEVLGFPTVKNEEWKYTNLSKFISEEWNRSEAIINETEKLSIAIDNIIPKSIESHRLVFCNGQFRNDLSSINPEDNSFIISSFSEALKNNKALVNEYFGKGLLSDTNGLTALNTAFASEGCFIHVPKGVKPKYPVHLINISGGSGEKFMNQVRNLIIIEDGAQLDLIETYTTIGSNEYLSNIVSEIFVKENAVFNQYRFQLEDVEKANQVNFTQITQQSHSLVNNMTITLGGKLVRNDLNYKLADKDCESHLFGLYIGSASQHIDNHTLVDHAMPQCFSNEFYKGILADKSTGVFNGKIIVRPDAQKTNAYQSNKNVLLSDEAHINTKPQLEIFANDVKCSHGATTGQLDDEALFYLRSRGIGAAEAKAMLTTAFAADVLENIKLQPLKEYAIQLVTEKLNAITIDHLPNTKND